MHLLMSYCGSIGSLMAESGLAEILSVAFSGVRKMLTGRKYPQNVRALRLLVEKILRSVFDENDMESMEYIHRVLEAISEKSRTAKLWIDCLILPVFTMLKYIRAERESDWLLHLDTVRSMVPLFFAADHAHYYLRSMESLPDKPLCEGRTYYAP